MTTWHEQDDFWEAVPLFDQDRIEMAVREVDFVLSVLGLEPGAAILDLCCGVGRHSLELARRGYRVSGVDRTSAYLQTARERTALEFLDVEWIQADMRDFVRPDAFDGAINLFTSFGYFEDPAEDHRVVQNIFRSLRPGGTLIMEMMGKEILARIFLPHDWREMPDGTLFLQERSLTRDWTWIENRWILVKDGQKREFATGHRIYDGAGLKALLLDVGFESVELFGALAKIPYDTNARRLVAVARRASI
ncbi:MAG TPA: class I SAM-dependent methyltransferase [Anaerolineae bacterium]|nr:class I SAM-dependent methyltransferase [Anaerolineae bacterium]